MLDDFFVRAVLAGVGVSLVAGPLGCFVVWRKMAYFGATMSHSALLGVALAVLLEIDPIFGVLMQGALVVPALIMLERFGRLSTDTLLGILAHGTLAIGVVVFGFMSWVRVDLMSYLFGDILAVSQHDLLIIYLGGAFILGILCCFWKRLLAGTVNAEIAAAEGLKPEQSKLVLMLLIACAIAISMKVVGTLLILSLLIIPAAAARAVSSTPEQMALLAGIVGILSTIGGLWASLTWNTASGPSIIVAALVLFLASLIPFRSVLSDVCGWLRVRSDINSKPEL